MERLEEGLLSVYVIAKDEGKTLYDVLHPFREAGAEIVVAGASIFHTPNPRQSFEELRRAAALATAEKV